MNRWFGVKLHMIKLILLMALFVSCFSCYFIPVSAAQKGECGEDLSWTLNAGTLTIKGEGAMTDFEEPEMSPWFEYREDIIRVVFPEKITSIGNLAFYGCKNLTSVVLPDTVTRIGHYAFAECESLYILDLGSGVQKIGKRAFYKCLNLNTVDLPAGLTEINDQAFYRCESLVTVSIPRFVTSFGNAVFAYCKRLISVVIYADVNVIPKWTFYSCDMLVYVTFPPNVKDVEDSAFEGCDSISTVFYQGSDGNASNIKQAIAEDVPLFADFGIVKNGTQINNTITSSEYIDNNDDTYTVNNYTVTIEDDVITTTIVEVTKEKVDFVPDVTPSPTPTQSPSGSPSQLPEATPSATSKPIINPSDKYDTKIIVTVKDSSEWDTAKKQVDEALKKVNNTYSNSAKPGEKVVDVYIQDGTIDNTFISEFTGRDLLMNVHTSDGSVWKVDCSELVENTVVYDTNYSYTVTEGSKDNAKELGTDNCYQLSFNEDAKINAQIVVKVPAKNTANSNAFLYQVEEDGSYTRLQAVRVGSDGNVNLYLGAVDDKTEYVIGIDVPDEKTDDVIIPDELAAEYNNAIERLEKIEYVITGVNSSWGMGMGRVTVILICVLVGCAVVVGVAMGIMNKRKLKKMYSNNAKV